MMNNYGLLSCLNLGMVMGIAHLISYYYIDKPVGEHTILAALRINICSSDIPHFETKAGKIDNRDIVIVLELHALHALHAQLN